MRPFVVIFLIRRRFVRVSPCPFGRQRIYYACLDGGKVVIRLRAAYEGLDFITAALLLTGQITIGGVFIQPEGLSLSLSGPFTGGGAIVQLENAKLVLDALDVLTAILLILRQIQVVGTYITVHRFTIVVSGPPFGAAWLRAAIPRTRAEHFYADFCNAVTAKMGLLPRKK